MADSDIEVPWKQFEQVVHRIECYLAPAGATVMLNDHITDKKTGSLRQVDASIRYKVGSVDILITIECRRHKDPQDATWIEQLAKKRENIGANATIAVASAGFFKTAGLLADYENVYLRTLEELEMDNFDWLQVKAVTMFNRQYCINGVEMRLWQEADEETNLVTDAAIIASVNGNRALYPFFIHIPSGKRYNAYRLIAVASEKGKDWFEGNEPDGPELAQQHSWVMSDQSVGVETDRGIMPVRAVSLSFTTKIIRRVMPAGNVFRYATNDETILEGAEYDLSALVPNQLIAVYRKGDGSTDILLKPKNVTRSASDAGAGWAAGPPPVPSTTL